MADEKMTADARKLAEDAYIISALDSQKPIGSREWCLFWQGWQAATASLQAEHDRLRTDFMSWLQKYTSGELDSEEVKELTCQLAEARKALGLAKLELHEMALAQRHHNSPRNPEMTQKAIGAIEAALSSEEK